MTGRVELKPLTDVEAVRYLTDKQVGSRLSFDWRDVREAEHAASFVVAKAMNSSILTDIYGELVKALEEGRTLAQFQADLKPRLEAKGWWGRSYVRDPKTGQLVEAQLGSARRLTTIYDNNMRMAHAAGRWERMERTARPGDLLRYKHTDQAHPRLDHKAWDGITLPIDHPFWKTHYTPNGWGCKCFTLLIPAARVRREGIVATSEAELAQRGVGNTVPWLNRRTGQVEQIPAGIDPGFAYNVGQARLRAFTPSPAGGVGRAVAVPTSGAPDMPRPRVFTGPTLAADVSDEVALKAFLSPFEGKARTAAPGQLVFDDAAQVPIAISDRLFVDRLNGQVTVALGASKADLPVLAATIVEPDEIWASFEDVRDEAGKVVSRAWRRRYIARWTMPGGGQQSRMIVFEEDGTTWSDADPAALANGGREGVLIYRRPE